MKEKKLTDKKVLDTLNERGFIEIKPICHDCAMRIIDMVSYVFGAGHFDIFTIEDETYCLRISV